jgi:tetratricopeptide (TPR) repeat protein
VSVRVGIHTGPVLVGEMGAGERRETMALGETMNLAARLQACAPPGGVVVSDATLRLVRGVFVVEGLGPQSLAGIAEPVEAHRVLQRSGVRSRLDAAGGRLTPFVSRERELARLLSLWDDASGGAGRAALICGEPGIGKSRLVHELRERLRETPHTWLEARGSSYTQNTPFGPAVGLIESALGIEPADDDATRLEKLRAGTALAGVSGSEALGVLAGLLSIEAEELRPPVMSPELTRRRTIDVLGRWVLALARLQPLVLLAEDLHWCDSGTLDLFEQLLVEAHGEPLLLVGTTRPELAASWRENPQLERVDLAPLRDEEARELLRHLGDGRRLPDPVVSRVLGEADGVPLFAEEIGRMVIESGIVAERGDELVLTGPIDRLEIPATLQDSLMARLDRLSAAKRVAQLASVLGREFDHALLEEVSGLDRGMIAHGLTRLVDDDLIFRSGEPPDARYTFKHALIQDAAYRSLVRRSRRPLHERAAAALERRGAEAEVLARHWEAAGRPRDALDAYSRAAEDAARRSSHTEAIEHLRRAIELVPQLPEDEERALAEIEARSALGASIMALRGFADPEIESVYDRARELCGGLEQDARVGYTLIGLAIYYFNSGRIAAGADLAESALGIASREGDASLELLARVQLAIPRLWQARFAEALEHGEAAIALYDPGRHRDLALRYGTDQGVAARCAAGFALTFSGRPDRGIELARDAVALARRLGNPFGVVYALTWEACMCWIQGDHESQLAYADEIVAVAGEQGFRDFDGIGRILRGTAVAVGRHEPAGLEECQSGLELASSTGRRGSATGLLEAIATAHWSLGRDEEAGGWLAAANALAEETGERWCEARLLRLRGELAAGRGDRDGAKEAFERGAAVAAAAGDSQSRLLCATSLARLLREGGDAGAAERLVRPLYSELGEGRETGVSQEAGALLAEA